MTYNVFGGTLNRAVLLLLSVFATCNSLSCVSHPLSVWLFECTFCIIMSYCLKFTQTEEQKMDFSHLPPSQQEKQLKLKIVELKSSYAKEVAARLGLSCLICYTYCFRIASMPYL